MISHHLEEAVHAANCSRCRQLPNPQLLSSTIPAAPRCACGSPSELTLLGLRRLRPRSRLPRGQLPGSLVDRLPAVSAFGSLSRPLRSGVPAPRRPSGKPPASPRCQANHTPVSHKPGAGTTLCPCAGRRGGLQRGEPTSERSPVGTCPPGQSPVSHKSLSPAHPFDTTHCSFKGEDQGYKFSKGPFQALCYWVRLIWGGLGQPSWCPRNHTR